MSDSMKDDSVDDAQRRRLLAMLPWLALAGSACAQDAAQVQPQAYRVSLDNDQMRVLDFVSRPGMGVCGSGVHSHPAHLTVSITDCRARETIDGKDYMRDCKAGFVFWSPAVTHETENLSGREARALIVELKSPPPAKA